ncbi:MAG: hypothetical protein Q4615_14035 [Paracoccus aminovorans]|nr:hypothetical protein [Paracoccus aminovorans]
MRLASATATSIFGLRAIMRQTLRDLPDLEAMQEAGLPERDMDINPGMPIADHRGGAA